MEGWSHRQVVESPPLVILRTWLYTVLSNLHLLALLWAGVSLDNSHRLLSASAVLWSYLLILMPCGQVSLPLLVSSLKYLDGMLFGTPRGNDKLAPLQQVLRDTWAADKSTPDLGVGEEKSLCIGCQYRQCMWDSSHLTLDVYSITAYVWVTYLNFLLTQ